MIIPKIFPQLINVIIVSFLTSRYVILSSPFLPSIFPKIPIMFANKTIILMVLAFAIFTKAFTFQNRQLSTIRVSKHTLSMMWDIKKFKKSNSPGIVETTPPPSEDTQNVSELFRRVPPGSGTDERSPLFTQFDQDAEILSKLDLSFRQQNLKMTLEHPSIGEVVKMNHIQAAVFSSTLPSSIFSGTSKVASIVGGGLLNDWETTI